MMRLPTSEQKRRLRSLPSVEVVAHRAQGVPRALAVAAARMEIEDARRRLLEGGEVDLSGEALDERMAKRVQGLAGSHLRPVINATGVILHTNLGRAPLAEEAAAAAALAGSSYTNLEYDLDSGQRGSRHDHLGSALVELTGAEAGLAVNNNAAAVLLALTAMAGGGEVVVSRGQLIEIGDSFRIPDVLAQSGARLVEVGTTNRTRIGDYEAAIGRETKALLRVHQSNFRMDGFVEEVPLADLCQLGRERELPVIDDLGSGAIQPVADEPTVSASVRAGAVTCCSADKLLGGPQAGLILGSAEAIERCRRHPLARALRLDKLQLAALEATLRLWRFHGRRATPVGAMLECPQDELERRAGAIAERIGPDATVVADVSKPGGGAAPNLELAGPVCAVDPGRTGADELSARLRKGDPPIVVRVKAGRVLIDPRTVDRADLPLVADVVRSALRQA